MTAAELLAKLIAQGFSLDVREDRIGVEPGSRLTKAQFRAIRRHKPELLQLLRAKVQAKAEEEPRKKRQVKSAKPSEAPQAVEPTGDGGQPPSSNGPSSVAVPERKRPKPPLCSTCWQLGYPNCRTCCLAYDSSLELGPDGELYRVRLQTEEDRLDWRRCEVCHNPFQAPRYGSPNVCPECRNRVHRSR